MISFEGGTLLFREMVTMLESWDVIHRGPALFLCTIHVPLSVNHSCENKIKRIVNDAKMIRRFSVKAKQLVNLNNSGVLNGSYVNYI